MQICPNANEIYTAANGFKYIKNSAGVIRRIEHKPSVRGTQTRRLVKRMITREMFAESLSRAQIALNFNPKEPGNVPDSEQRLGGIVPSWIEETGDEDLIMASFEGRDAYKVAASKLFGVTFEQVTLEQRRIAKDEVLSGGYARLQAALTENKQNEQSSI